MTAARAPAEKPPTLVSLIDTYYRDHPGLHRCQDVAAALGHPRIDTRRVAVESRRLADKESHPLERKQVRRGEGRKDMTMYGYPAS